MANARRDNNFVPTLLGVSSTDGSTPVTVYADPTTHRLLVDAIATITFQPDVFTSTNNQTVFTATKTVTATIYLSINGSIQTPNVDYTESSGVITLTSGIPSGNVVIWFYQTP